MKLFLSSGCPGYYCFCQKWTCVHVFDTLSCAGLENVSIILLLNVLSDKLDDFSAPVGLRHVLLVVATELKFSIILLCGCFRLSLAGSNCSHACDSWKEVVFFCHVSNGMHAKACECSTDWMHYMVVTKYLNSIWYGGENNLCFCQNNLCACVAGQNKFYCWFFFMAMRQTQDGINHVTVLACTLWPYKRTWWWDKQVPFAN